MAQREIDMDTTTKPVVDTTKHTIFIGLNSGLKTGDQVTYDAELGTSGNAAIGNLTDGHQYYVNVAEDGTATLYNSKDDAENGTNKINIGSGGAGTEQKLEFDGLPFTDGSINLKSVAFNPTGTVTLLDLGEGTGLHTGDAVEYDAKGGAAITNLPSGKTYYIIELGDGDFQLAASADDARSGKAIAISGSGNTNQRLIDQSDSFITTAKSGAGGGKVGVAGSVAVNVVNADTEAVVGRTPGVAGPSTASLTVNGDVSIAAAVDMSNDFEATPSDGGGKGEKVGVGASVGINVVNNTVNAEFTDGATWAGTAGLFSVTATSGDAVFTHAKNGASGGTAAIGVGASVAVINDTVTAYVGTGDAISATGDVTVSATHTGAFKNQADAEANSDSVAIGASVAVDVVNDSITAEVARGISTSGGGFTLTANTTASSDAEAVAATGGEKKDDLQEQNSKSGKSGADGQVDHQVNDNSTTSSSSTSNLPSAKDSASSGNSRSEFGVRRRRRRSWYRRGRWCQRPERHQHCANHQLRFGLRQQGGKSGIAVAGQFHGQRRRHRRQSEQQQQRQHRCRRRAERRQFDEQGLCRQQRLVEWQRHHDRRDHARR